MMGAGKIDWEAIRLAYIRGGNVSELAKRFNVSAAYIGRKRTEEKWVEQRARFQEKAAKKALEKAVNVEAVRLGKIIQAADDMAAVIGKLYGDPEQFQRHMVTETVIDEDGKRSTRTVEKVYAKTDTRAISDMTRALKDMTLVLRNLHNLPTQPEAEAQRIAAERLKLEQKRADADRTDREITVQFEGGSMEEYAK